MLVWCRITIYRSTKLVQYHTSIGFVFDTLVQCRFAPVTPALQLTCRFAGKYVSIPFTIRYILCDIINDWVQTCSQEVCSVTVWSINQGTLFSSQADSFVHLYIFLICSLWSMQSLLLRMKCVFNPFHDALKHHFTSLKTYLIFL